MDNYKNSFNLSIRNNIFDLFPGYNCTSISFKKDKNGEECDEFDAKYLYIYLEQDKEVEINTPYHCPKCNSTSIRRHGLFEVEIADTPIGDKKVILVITKPRYKCKECQKAFFQDIIFKHDQYRMTNRLYYYILNSCKKIPLSIVKIATELDIDRNIISRIKNDLKEQNDIKD